MNFNWNIFYLQNFIFNCCCSKSELIWNTKNQNKKKMFRPTNVKKNTKIKSKHWPPVSRRYSISYMKHFDWFHWIDSLFCIVCLFDHCCCFWADLFNQLVWSAIKIRINMLAIHKFEKAFFKGQELTNLPEIKIQNAWNNRQ